jgi:hypothetical protein
MGRYAQFSTGLEYKFLFAIQSSEDIKDFGGQEIDTDDPQYNMYYSEHEWSYEDKNNILTILNKFGEGFIMPDFEKYEKNIEGTYNLYSNEPFYVEEDNHDSSKGSKFTLGCLIYHQLLYTNNLSVKYEL